MHRRWTAPSEVPMSKAENLDNYPLRTVSRLTGLSPDVIRAWEKRYSVVAPVRGARGARLYSREDIDHLRSLARAVAGGRAIGDIARLEREQVKRLADETAPALDETTESSRAAGDNILDRALSAVAMYDDAALRTELGDALAIMGPVRFVREVGAPFLTTVGERWHAGDFSIAQEHMATSALRNFLHSAISSRRSRTARPAVLLATTTGQKHEGGLLMVALLLLEQRVEIAYLGPEMPVDDIVTAAKELGVSVVALSFTTTHAPENTLEEIRAIERDLPAPVELWLGGMGAAEFGKQLRSTRTVVFESLEALHDRAAHVQALQRPGH
jgi:DNA-binding transcriptional MerR regulator/methylmalonyl-CoA mutase cobalamin-binding subunit